MNFHCEIYFFQSTLIYKNSLQILFIPRAKLLFITKSKKCHNIFQQNKGISNSLIVVESVLKKWPESYD